MSTENVYATKSDLARRRIQKMILSGELRAGDRITTRVVSDVLGISETPIREAIRGLVADGWLDIQNHVGAIVRKLRPEHIHEISALRGLVCSLAIELSGEFYNAAFLSKLEKNLVASEAAVAKLSVKRFAELNIEFHHMLCDTPYSPWCQQIFINVLGLMSSQRHGFSPNENRLRQAVKEHRQIYEHLLSKDFAAAASVARKHELNAGAFLIGEMRNAGVFEN